ncbi:hypothetical protein [Levilactobacillus humaensis]|uniref:hypothetical protein n=1 Tax=Levilactobacillus humaensis TaxID=2950375 RepID=UPI0021C44FD2|nr:hypothetical protein [Levilactobacillus humaensis]
MAKLKDLLPKVSKQETITIQGVEIPIAFTMKSMDYVQEAYGKSFAGFQSDFDKMLKKKTQTLDTAGLKLVNALIYAMVRSGGTETTPDELMNAIGFDDLKPIYEKAMNVFSASAFQPEDAEKLGAKK